MSFELIRNSSLSLTISFPQAEFINIKTIDTKNTQTNDQDVTVASRKHSSICRSISPNIWWLLSNFLSSFTNQAQILERFILINY